MKTPKTTKTRAVAAKSRTAKPKKTTVTKKRSAASGKLTLKVAIEALKKALATHGGDIELVTSKAGVVTVRLHGACSGCPMAAMTLRDTVERYLVAKVPGVTKVVAAE